ncbi:MAG: DUF883 family protein [Verrucomicrobiae bacterium]|nr:DUF883 family protein [Verrucomicrobiae bacterium]
MENTPYETVNLNAAPPPRASEEAIEAIEESVSDFQGQAQRLQERAKERAQEIWRKSDEYIRANPWKGVGTGLACGLIAGILMAFRRSA